MAIYFSKPLEDGSRYVFMTGYLTRDVKTSYTVTKKIPKVMFGIAYDSKQFMNVLCLGDEPVTRFASCLERGDTVFIAGKWTSKVYTTKDGEEKTWTEVKADFISLQSDIQSAAAPEEPGDAAPKTQSFSEIDDNDDDYGDLPF